MSRRPTKRALVFVGVGGLLVIVGSTAQANWLFVLAAVVFGIVASSLFARARIDRYEATRRLPARATVGDEIDVQLHLRNGARKGFAPGVRAIDLLAPYGPLAYSGPGLPPGGVARGALRARLSRRGVFREGRIVITTGWPFGLIQCKRSIPVASSITVLPQLVDVANFPLTEIDSRRGCSDRPSARAGAGSEFMGVRDYRAGDDARHIHWRSSARRSSLVVREYEDDADEHIAIIVAGTDDGTPPESAFETLISAAASVARHALTRSFQVDLLRAGEDGRCERCSSPNLFEAMDWFASARPSEATPLPLVQLVVGSAQPPGSLILFATSAGGAGEGIVPATKFARERGLGTVTVIADSASWSEGVSPPLPNVPGPRRVLSRDRELSQCLSA